MVIEIEAPVDGTEAPADYAFRAGSTGDGASVCATTYLRSTSCGLDDWGPVDTVGADPFFPDSQLIMSASGHTPAGAVVSCPSLRRCPCPGPIPHLPHRELSNILSNH